MTTSASGADAPSVDILGVRFPRISHDAAVAELVEAVRRRETRAVCFPDMSTLNIAARDPQFRRLLQRRVTTWNDGAGLALAARLQRRPFPANLNGTDLCPALLAAVPGGTSVSLLGARPGVADRARDVLAARFGHVRFVGSHHGYLTAAEVEEAAVEQLRRERPHIVMVGMGNPLQIEFIDRHLDDPALAGTLWLAVGGQLDYYGGGLERAPGWMVRMKLEWLHLVIRQPHKLRRYLFGIPTFVGRCVVAQIRSQHAAPVPVGP